MNHNVKEAANRVRMLRLKQCFTARENAEVTASMLADAETLADYVWELATSPEPAPTHVGDAGILIKAIERYIRLSSPSSYYMYFHKALDAYAASVPPTAPDAERVRLLEEVAKAADALVTDQSATGWIDIRIAEIKRALEALHAHN
mgnify:CR=1 FL=1